MTDEQFKAPSTPAELNQQLQALQLPALSESAIAALYRQEPRERIYNALCHAATNSGAMQYLKKLTDQYAGQPARQHEAAQSSASRPASRAASTPEKEDQNFLSHHVYGQKAALTFSAAKYKGRSTVMLDGAVALQPRKFDWTNKITIAMTQAEIPAVAAVIFGLSKQAEFSNHGPNNNKSFRIEHQGNKLFVTLSEKDKKMVAVPVPLTEAYYIGNLFLKQMADQHPWMRPTDIINSLRLTAGRQ